MKRVRSAYETHSFSESSGIFQTSMAKIFFTARCMKGAEWLLSILVQDSLSCKPHFSSWDKTKAKWKQPQMEAAARAMGRQGQGMLARPVTSFLMPHQRPSDGLLHWGADGDEPKPLSLASYLVLSHLPPRDRHCTDPSPDPPWAYNVNKSNWQGCIPCLEVAMGGKVLPSLHREGWRQLRWEHPRAHQDYFCLPNLCF